MAVNLNLSKQMLNDEFKKIIISGQIFKNADLIFNNNYSD